MIFQQLNQQLHSLHQLLYLLNDKQYTHNISHLGKASIGGHTRHILELLQCAITGYSTETIDYINRKRNLALQTNRHFAMQTIEQLQQRVQKSDKLLGMLVDSMPDSTNTEVSTTYFREIVYNTEHCIHHLALIKVALIEMNLDLVDDHFGMAYSTLKYNASLTAAHS